MRTVFADSFYFFALLNNRDSAHEKATAFVHSYFGRVITTHWVLTELADGLSHPANRFVFMAALDELRADPRITVVGCSDELFKAGTSLFGHRPDKYWSLSDCISFVVMEREGITEALTGDKHFEQAGFVALLK